MKAIINNIIIISIIISISIISKVIIFILITASAKQSPGQGHRIGQ